MNSGDDEDDDDDDHIATAAAAIRGAPANSTMSIVPLLPEPPPDNLGATCYTPLLDPYHPAARSGSVELRTADRKKPHSILRALALNRALLIERGYSRIAGAAASHAVL